MVLGREDDENTLVGVLLPPDFQVSVTIAGVTESWEDTREWTMCLHWDLSVIVTVLSNTTKIECGHHSPIKTLCGFQTAKGWVTLLLDVIFQNHSSLWVCITVRQPSTLLHREPAEDSKHTHEPLHISSLILDPVSSVTLEIFYLGITNP